jgi:succinoglycan biosynthesis transport protein ExoP
LRRENSSVDLVPFTGELRRGEAVTGPRDLAAAFFRRKAIMGVLFGSVLAGAAVGAIYLRPRLFPPRYASELRFILRKDRFDAVVTPFDRAVPTLNTTVAPQEIQSEIEILRSSDVLDRLAREARVASPERLDQGLTVEPVTAGRNFTNLIAVRYSSPDPAEVARVLEALPRIYAEKYVAVNRRPAAVEYYRSQADDFEQQLRQAEADLAEFEKGQPELVAVDVAQRARQKLSDLEKQKSDSESAIREARSRVAELTRELAVIPVTIRSARQIGENPYLERLQLELLEAQNRRSEAKFYREIDRLETRIGELRQQIQEAQSHRRSFEENLPNPLRQTVEGELVRAKAALAGLQSRLASISEQEHKAREELAASRLIAAENASEKAELSRNVKIAEEGYMLYRKKYTEAEEAEALDQKGVLNVSVAEPARPPFRVASRGVWFYFAASVLLAAAVAAAGGFAAELADHSIHTPAQLEAQTSLSVLACIPESKRR